MQKRGIVAVHADQAATHERGHVDRVHEPSMPVPCEHPRSVNRTRPLGQPHSSVGAVFGTDPVRALLAKER